LLGFRGGFASYISDAPRISDACETKFGCSKCVDLCPAKALRTNERNEIVVSEHECTRCGLCASTCPVSAIQLPRFSESAFLGLIAGLEKSEAPKKTLVLTCDESRVKREPWMYVQEVKDVGIIGRRHTAIAASSNLGAIIVYCADGECVGKQKAKESAESVRSVVRPGSIAIEYLEGVEAAERIEEIHSMSNSRKETLLLGARSWDNYVKSLKYITRSDASLEGLGLTNLLVSDACTLCNACAISCPHSSIRLTSGKIQFDSSTCTGCGNCASVCPEHAVSLKPLVLISDLSPRLAYHDDEIVNCLRCGKPLDSAKFLKRVASLAGTEDQTMTMIQYCQECKKKVAFERLFKTVQSPAK
ncbi:MAG: 4Fe-4S binding protein, partial [Nitrososphaerota archaeon]|nr:4Fe-4S binding protein [Nitrososphaerota archaeon]